MTATAPTLEYASPRVREGTPHKSLIFAVALAAGLLEANAFADAVGIAPIHRAEDEPGSVALRVLCGVVVGFVAWAIMLFLVREGRALTSSLSRSPQKPGQAVAITCIITGAVCLLGALAIPLFFARAGSVRLTSGGATVSTEMPMLAQLLAVLTFVAGAFLIGVGIWSGIGRKAAGP